MYHPCSKNFQVNAEADDALSAAKGIILGLIISLGLWAGIIATAIHLS